MIQIKAIRVENGTSGDVKIKIRKHGVYIVKKDNASERQIAIARRQEVLYILL